MPTGEKAKAEANKARLAQQQRAQQQRVAQQMAAAQAKRDADQKRMADEAERKRADDERRRQALQREAASTEQAIEGIVAHVKAARQAGAPSANAGTGCRGGTNSPIDYYPHSLPYMKKYGGALDNSFSAGLKFRIKDPPDGDILVHAKAVLQTH